MHEYPLLRNKLLLSTMAATDDQKKKEPTAIWMDVDKRDFIHTLACGSSGSKVPILPDSTTVHYPPYTTVCCIVVATYSLHVEVHPSF